MKYFYLLLTSLFICFQQSTMGQLINGSWTGNYAKTLLSMNPRTLVVELELYNDSMLSGASHLYYGGGRYEHHKLTGKFNPVDSSAIFSESLVETNLSLGVFDVLYNVKLVSTGSTWRLEGKWKGTKSIFGYMPYNKVWLEKPKEMLLMPDTMVADQVKYTASIPSIKKDSILLNRVTDIQKIIEVSRTEKDSIHVEVYDNGEIDHDSISIYLNDKPVVKHTMISDKPLSFYLSLDKDTQFQKIKMIAENLGSIPPNTAVMIITTRQKRYEVRMSSDLEKNAVVEFVLLE